MALRERTGPPSFRVLLLAAPLIFVAHFMEEAPDFVAWFNAHVARDITPSLFWTVNYTALAITLVVVTLEWTSGTAASIALVVAWLSGLMFANALFHIVGAIIDRAYTPGLVTALLLYLPFYSWVVLRALQLRRLQPRGVAVAALLGATPMLAHGFLILFRGSRLF